MKKIITLFVVGILLSQVTLAQDCANKLKQAKDLYEQGLLEKVYGTIAECLVKGESKKGGFSKAQLLEAYKLLTITYLYDDEYDLADEYLLKLLKLEPEFEVNPAVDPIEFIQLFNSYRTLPIYSFGFQAGGDWTFVQRTARFGVEPLGTLQSGAPNFSSYSGGAGFTGGIKVSRYLSARSDVTLGAMYRTNTFTYTSSLTLGFASTVSEETQNWLYLPVTFNYNFKKDRKDKLWPYLRVGIGAGIRLDAEASLVRSYEAQVSVGAIQGIEVDLSSQRRSLYLWGVAGMGIKYKIKRGYLFADLTYNQGLMNVVNTSNRYANSELIYKYYYVDDDFLTHGAVLTVGFMRSLYKPKKLSHNPKVKKKKSSKSKGGDTGE